MSKRIMDEQPIKDDNEISELIYDKNIIIVAKNLTKDYEIGEYVVRAVDKVSLDIINNDVYRFVRGKCTFIFISNKYFFLERCVGGGVRAGSGRTLGKGK